MNHQPQATRSSSTQRALVIGVATAASALIVLATSVVANRAEAQTPTVHVEPALADPPCARDRRLERE